MDLLLVDVEGIIYRSIIASEQEIEWAPDQWTYNVRLREAKGLVLEELQTLRAWVPGCQLAIALGDSWSFRYWVWPGYKESRKKNRRPAGFGALLDWLTRAAETHGFMVLRLPGVEADDVIGVYSGPGTIIASGDKDLRTVPGAHLLPEGEVMEVSRESADWLFFCQTLTGDPTDGYPGCPGMGEVKAKKALASCNSPQEQWRAVLDAYAKAGLSAEAALIQARCARILRPGEYDHERQIPKLWFPPALAGASVAQVFEEVEE